METIRVERDAAGIAWVIFDDPNAKVNLFNAANFARLENVIDELRAGQPAGVVFISGKPGTFIAGADIHEIAAIRDAAHALELSRYGQRLFDKIEQLGVPTVAAIDGVCLGGGFEMALACRYRVATDNPQTQIGLPETQLGILPGWGGTQRLPELIGLSAALRIIVPGKVLDAKRALKAGLVDAVVPVIALREKAVAAVLSLCGAKRKRTRKGCGDLVGGVVRAVARRQTLQRSGGHYPAPLKAIEVAGRGVDAEARGLAELASTEVARNLVRVFFLREKYAKLKVGSGAVPVRKIGVLGAGVMGSGIAQWCSARGLTVRLKDVEPQFVAAGMQRIAAVYRDGVRRRKLTELEAQRGLARVHPTTDDTGFADCDVVIEAVVEKLTVKRTVLGEMAKVLPPGKIVASNTSALSIDDLAGVSGRPAETVGLHFFNPVHRMPLVEVVRGRATSEATLATAVELVKQLKKIPVVVWSGPGFVVNRILMPYLNEAGLLLGSGVDLRAIDEAMVAFGWPMGPLRLVDEVGVDVALEVAHEMAGAFPKRMQVAPVLAELLEAGRKGRKTGQGLYDYTGSQARPSPRFKGRSLAAGEIQERLMAVMVAEAKLCLVERVVENEDDVDLAMIFGTGFPPYRGGLVTWARAAGKW